MLRRLQYYQCGLMLVGTAMVLMGLVGLVSVSIIGFGVLCGSLVPLFAAVIIPEQMMRKDW